MAAIVLLTKPLLSILLNLIYFRFTDKLKLKSHLSSVHSQVQFVCDLCGKVFNTKVSTNIAEKLLKIQAITTKL